MNVYKNYQQARDAAWQMLIDCHVCSLPVNVGRICQHYGYRLYSYSKNAQILRRMGLSEQTKRTDGFTVYADGIYYIFFNDAASIQRQRFTVAHEIGHIQLRHIGDGQVTRINREPDAHDDPTETQANQFAARILAPACVLHALDAITAEQISKLCGISIRSAQFRADRMKVLENRQMFLSHPLERQVMLRFRDFINPR